MEKTVSMNDLVSIEHDHGEDGSVITGSGILDLTNTSKLREFLEEAVASGGEVAVDFGHAVFIDSAVLQYLGSASRAMTNTGRRLKVIVSESLSPGLCPQNNRLFLSDDHRGHTG